MTTFTIKKWFAREHDYFLGPSTQKKHIWLSLDEKLSTERIVDILLNTSGLPDPFYHPVNLYLHYTRGDEALKESVLYRLGINEFKGDKYELLSLLYMIVASDMWSVQLAKEICNVSRKKAIASFREHSDYEDDYDYWLYPVAIVAYTTGYYPYIELGSFNYFESMKIANRQKFSSKLRKRMKRLMEYSASEIIILSEYYSGNYDPITKKRKLNLIHPYNIILYKGFLPVTAKVDKIGDYIARWVREDYKMDMLPSNAMLERDYIWDALTNGRYYLVANKHMGDEETIENSSDKALVEFLQKTDPELHIVFKTRVDLMSLVRKVLIEQIE